MKTEKECLLEYNGLYKENNEFYRNAARTLGLSDCAFWILYSLREGNRELSQSEICSVLYVPKQTVNSSLKKLEEDGMIELREGTDRRSKRVHLTEKGTALAAQTVDRVLEAELRTMGQMPEEERTAFLRLFRRYTELLKKEIGDITEAGERIEEK